MTIDRRAFCVRLSAGYLLFAGAVGSRSSLSTDAKAIPPARGTRTVALMFDSLISPFWVTSLEIMRREAARRGWNVLETVSNMDDDRQYQQLQSMLQRHVDGIVMVHTNDKAVVPAIRAANAANTPLVHFNRPPAPSDAYSVAVVADNRKIMRETVAALVEEARRRGGQFRAAILLGDLTDGNAVQRRAGFEDAIAGAKDFIQVVAQIPTEWNADKAFAGLVNAIQAHPDINFLVSSSDFLTPQIEQALRIAGKWKRFDDPDHVLIAAFDGDSNAYAQLASGYYDADGVQDLDYEVGLSFDTLEQLWAGHRPAKILVDPGFVVTRDNLAQARDRMWGYDAWKGRAAANAPAALNAGGSTFAIRGFARALFSFSAARDTLLALVPLAVLVTGQVFVLLIGQIDLSMTAVMAVGSVVSASVMGHAQGLGAGAATALGISACLLIGLAVGLLNGVCTARLRLPSFIVTLAVMMIGAGAAVWYGATAAQAGTISHLPDPFVAIGYGRFAGVPIAGLVSAVVLTGAAYLLSRTLWGRWIYAIGQNATAARVAGVPVTGMTIVAFTLSGLCAAFASVIYTSRVETGLPTLGGHMLLDIIGAAVIGGVSLFGGRGSVWGALTGAIFLCVLDKSLQLLGLSLFIVLALKGLAILMAAIVDALRQRHLSRNS